MEPGEDPKYIEIQLENETLCIRNLSKTNQKMIEQEIIGEYEVTLLAAVTADNNRHAGSKLYYRLHLAISIGIRAPKLCCRRGRRPCGSASMGLSKKNKAI